MVVKHSINQLVYNSVYISVTGIWCFTLGYIAMFTHKGRLLTITAGIMAGGAFIMFLPHLLVGQYHLGVKATELCDVYGEFQFN